MNAFVKTPAAYETRRSHGISLDTLVVVGTSFKHEHLPAILADGFEDGFFEVHAENYMGGGGPPHRTLATVREAYPLSIHGVCMSIGAPSRLDARHLARFRELVIRYEPVLVSEHLAWSSHGGAFFNDLLPLPYTKATLDTVCEHIDQVQDAIRRPILLENPSTYIAFASSTMSESEFIREVVQRTGCGLLLDINNVFVSAVNHRFSAETYLDELPLERVGEIHLAGHSEQRDDEDEMLLVDSHDCVISDSVWHLYRDIVGRIGPRPTLVEWDSNLPAWSVLRDQALSARRIMTEQMTLCSQEIGRAG
ncbi:MNIO family bufferin maturase [Paraburkholderia sp. 32]|uniref:MNIO family bufferin maturase n=1 Tax=Paraburkholderia sp. 32 TaxID=2991057 RepID=UPI003D199437